MILKAITLSLALSGILFGEGFVCILFAAPLFYFVGIIIGLAADWRRRSAGAREPHQRDGDGRPADPRAVVARRRDPGLRVRARRDRHPHARRRRIRERCRSRARAGAALRSRAAGVLQTGISDAGRDRWGRPDDRRGAARRVRARRASSRIARAARGVAHAAKRDVPSGAGRQLHHPLAVLARHRRRMARGRARPDGSVMDAPLSPPPRSRVVFRAAGTLRDGPRRGLSDRHARHAIDRAASLGTTSRSGQGEDHARHGGAAGATR